MCLRPGLEKNRNRADGGAGHGLKKCRIAVMGQRTHEEIAMQVWARTVFSTSLLLLFSAEEGTVRLDFQNRRTLRLQRAASAG